MRFVRQRQERENALLAAETDGLTAHDIAAASAWADKLRNVNENAQGR